MRREGDDVGALFGIGGGNDPIHPLDVIIEAYNYTTYEEINGSSCICVATLGVHSLTHSLTHSNTPIHSFIHTSALSSFSYHATITIIIIITAISTVPNHAYVYAYITCNR